MIKFLSRVHLGTILLLPALIFFFLIISQKIDFVGEYYEVSNGVDLGMWGVYPLAKFYNQLLCGSVILFNAILLNRLFNRQNLHTSTTLLPGIVYVLLLSATHSFYSMNGDLIFQTFLIFVFFPLTKSNFNQENYGIPFNVGFLMSLGATCYPLFFVFFPLFYLIILFIRSFTFRHFMFYLSGWLTPLVYLFTFLHFTKVPLENYLSFWTRLYVVNLSEVSVLLDLSILLLAFILSLPAGKMIADSVELKVGKQVRVMTYFSVVATAVALSFFVFYGFISAFQIIVIPTAFLLAAVALKSSRSSIYHPFLLFVLVYSVVKFFFLL